MFNKVILVGNLTRDCELRYLPSGSAVCASGIATNRKYKNQQGEQKEEVCFVDITFFGRTAEIANQYLGRGKKVLVEGRLKLDQWTDQSGGKRSKHSVTVDTLQMLDTKGDSNQGGGSNQPDNGHQQNNANQGRGNNQSNNGYQQGNTPIQNKPSHQDSTSYEGHNTDKGRDVRDVNVDGEPEEEPPF
jgi:single-strand DNA-binding protein